MTARGHVRSELHQARARASLVGGVATAFRASQRPLPLCFERGDGARIWDVDGNEYVDYVLGFGPLIHGHTPAPVIEAVQDQLSRGLGFGACHELEADLAEAICRTVPSAEQCVISNTGSEAVQVALRVARAATGRSRIVKFLGHYHGWLDSVHVGVPPQQQPGPGTGGQDGGAASATTVCAWNDVDALADELDAGDVAAVIMEPININGGGATAQPGYLEAVRALTRERGAVLIFDEVITGYRVALGGAQERLGVTPDLTVLGKALGAGFPISAVAGASAVLEVVANKSVAHVGTFNANPVCAAAALASVRWLEKNAATEYPRLERAAAAVASTLERAFGDVGIPLRATSVPGCITAFVGPDAAVTYENVADSDAETMRVVAELLLRAGMHVIPRGLMYVSTTHGDEELEATRAAIDAAAERAGVGAAGAPPA